MMAALFGLKAPILFTISISRSGLNVSSRLDVCIHHLHMTGLAMQKSGMASNWPFPGIFSLDDSVSVIRVHTKHGLLYL